MKITVRLFAGLHCENEGSECHGKNDFILMLKHEINLEEFINHIGISVQLAKIVLVNGLFKPLTYVIKDGDEIAIFPPLGGG
ncbi:MAG: MoaD/ThiS family protein [Eubacteriales bacterium]